MVSYDAANMNCCKEHKEEGVKNGFSWWWSLGLVPIGLIIIWGLKIPFGSVLPWGVFLLCPLMHIFMMKDHGGHGHGNSEEEKK